MRLEQGEQRSTPAGDRTFYGRDEPAAATMTPVRRAALDALEREFRDLLQAHAR